MAKIFITGAKGQLGRALTLLLQDMKQHIVCLTSHTSSEDNSIKELNIADDVAVNALIDEFKPDIIINCAAFTAVDLCEGEQDKAYQVNALGPKHLAMAATKHNSKLIHISTDYVFDGKGIRPYIETDVPDPINVYGKTKLQGEQFVIEHCEKSLILRTSWLYGDGKNFVRTMLRLADSGNKIRVVSDQYGTPTSAMELARVVLYFMETDSYGIYHVTCEGSCSWYEFAETIFREAQKDINVEAIPTAEYRTPATRPLYSILDNKALRERHGYYMMNWKDALIEYMREFK